MRNRMLLILVLLASISTTDDAYSGDSSIIVYYNRDIGLVNRKIFGNNFKSRDPVHTGTLPYYSNSDYGSGVWDPKWSKPNKTVMNLAKEAGVSVVRYAVGNHWDWKSAIGKKRKHFLFGLDEFLKTTEEIGADAVIMGDSLGQVASQTLQNILVVDDAVKIPILRPLIGFDKEDVVKIAREIGTYEISILPSDSCSAVPNKPSTMAKLERIFEQENKIDMNNLLKKAIDKSYILKI